MLNILRSIEGLNDIDRFNIEPRIHKESVASHCFFVAMCVMFLSMKVKDVDINKAIKMALLHDIEEKVSSDIPHTVKIKFPEFVEVLEDMNLKIVLKTLSGYDEFIALWKESRNGDTEESIMVKVADWVSVLLYTEKEMKMGNTYMEKIYNRQISALSHYLRDKPKYSFVMQMFCL